MIKDIKNSSYEERNCCFAENMGFVFGMAPHLGIWFDDAEIKYIKTKMMTHKLYRAVAGVMSGKLSSPLDARCSCIWLESFLNEPDLPLGVKAFIHYYIGAYSGEMKHSDQYDNKNRYGNYIAHSFLTERWMETCR